MVKKVNKFLAGLFAALFTISCSSDELNVITQDPSVDNVLAQAQRTNRNSVWQDQIIYFALTDRFNNGDKSNDFNVNVKSPYAYHGGDLQGLIDKLDYIKDLGATTIWITPPMDNRDNAFKANLGNNNIVDMYGYHGYWTKDYYAVDEHLGTMAKLKEFISKAHSKGIKILLDIVVNHTDYDHPFAKNRKDPNDKYYSWFNQNGDIKDYENQWWVEHGELAGLPDFNQDNPEVYKYLLDASKFWIKETGADGFRIDTVKHVPHSYWQQYTKDIRNFAGSDFLLLGEVLNGDPGYNAGYQSDGFDSLFDFPLYYAINDTFAKGGSMKRLGGLFGRDGSYANAGMLSPFIDNHDVPRFLSDTGGNGGYKLGLALSFIMTIRGIPMIYYGTEIGLNGGGEPDNRRDMPWATRNDGLINHVKKLMSIRKSQEALRRGRQLEMWQDDDIYAFLRTTGDSARDVITVLNNSDSQQTRTMQLRAESSMANGTKLVNLLGTDGVTVNNKSITVTLAAKEAKIFAVGSATNTIKKTTK